MTTELAKIQSYIPKSLLAKLAEYQKLHHLKSISQSVAAILIEVLSDKNTVSLGKTLSDEEIAHKVSQLETIVAQLTKRLAALEGISHSSASYEEDNPISLHSTNPSISPTSHQLISYDSQTAYDSDQSHDEFTCDSAEYCKQPIPTANESERIASDSPSESSQDTQSIIDAESTTFILELLNGVSGSTLVKRLNTNPTTLRKYIRENKRIDWAVQLDPDGLGWIYEPLLQRYYPVQVNTDGSIFPLKIETAQLVLVNCNSSQIEGITSKRQEINLETTDTSTQERRSDQFQEKEPIKSQLSSDKQQGLTQAQLSRLTGIPVNTLQRWKQQPDCSIQIQRRTQNQFTYRYSKQDARFYSVQ